MGALQRQICDHGQLRTRHWRHSTVWDPAGGPKAASGGRCQLETAQFQDLGLTLGGECGSWGSGGLYSFWPKRLLNVPPKLRSSCAGEAKLTEIEEYFRGKTIWLETWILVGLVHPRAAGPFLQPPQSHSPSLARGPWKWRNDFLFKFEALLGSAQWFVESLLIGAS